jgi:type I restriction enzyme, S subunit
MKSGWQQKSISEVCRVVNGGTPRTDVPRYWNGKHAWITPAEMGKRSTPYASDTLRRLSDLGLQDSSATLLPPLSVILSSRAPIGHLVINEVPMATNQGCKGLVPGENLDHKFLYYFLLGNIELLNALGTGATFKELSAGKLQTITMPVPRREEQRRIVAILDKGFAAIATAKANTEKNLQNARALFESCLDSIFTVRNGRMDQRSLVSVCSLFVDSAHRTPEYQQHGIPALRPRDVVNGRLNLDESARVSKSEYEIQTKRHKPAPGDIVYSRELSFGWAVLLPDSPTVCLSQGMCIFRPCAEIDPEYLLHILNGPIGRAQAKSAAVGATHPHINLSDIKSYMIPVLPMRDQKEAARAMNQLTLQIKRIEASLNRKVGEMDALRKSLLQAAFTGAL